MITLSQIKAARALLNWTQDNLAKAADLSLPGINNLERGISSPRKETLAAIENALTQAGIEFIDITGVRLKTPDLQIETIEGENWLAQYDQYLFARLKSDKDELLQYACDNRFWMIYGSSTNHYFVDHRNTTKFKERILAPSKLEFISSPADSYRTLSIDKFERIDKQIFADCVANILWDARKIVIVTSKNLADNERTQFELLWDQAKPFTKDQLKNIEQWDRSRPQKLAKD